MPRWLSRVLERVHGHAESGGLRLTYKGQRELLLLGLSPDDVRDVTASLRAQDSAGRLLSESTGEWLYAFKPEVEGQIIYLKLVLRASCIVISFHEDESGEDEATE